MIDDAVNQLDRLDEELETILTSFDMPAHELTDREDFTPAS